jgi:hypothetical protein|nr:MAG TPA: hypothetical protein [Caudoviricetes sp.]
MKACFKLQLAALIIANVKTYGKLFVTTKGQMFRSEDSCIETVRSTNAIVDDYEKSIGYVDLTKETFDEATIRAIGKDIEVFNDMFKDAKVPRQWTGQRDQFERQFEKPTDATKTEEENVAEMLGLKKHKAETKQKAVVNEPKTEAKPEPVTETAKVEVPTASTAQEIAKAADPDAIKKKLGIK